MKVHTSVLIEFRGPFANLAGMSSLVLEIPGDVEEPLLFLDYSIRSIIGFDSLYTVHYNNQVIRPGKNLPEVLKSGDSFQVVPVVLGG